MKNLQDLAVTKLAVSYQGAPVGMLTQTAEGLAAFQYDASWLRSGFSISPLSLPLEPRVFVAAPDPLNGCFGIFADSLPDGWGRLLVDRMLKAQGINPHSVDNLTRLAIVGSSGAGALEYQPQLGSTPTTLAGNLDTLAQDCMNILAARDVADLDLLFEMGGSSGGARPKVFYQLDGEEWIVKFPSSHDSPTIGLEEYQLALAAQAAGLEMAPVRLLPSQRCEGYFATKRFDRVQQENGDVRKVHMASVAALLETSHRIPNLDYDLLLKLTLHLTHNAQEVERLFTLMVFNVFCGNRDDHAKNFSFLALPPSHSEMDVTPSTVTWRLSPAYDLTCNPGMNGEHATTIHGKGKDITKDDLLAVAKRAGIKATQAKAIIERVATALAICKDFIA